jgi:hypothetical protein
MSDRVAIDLSVLQSLGSFFGNIGIRDLPTDPEALMRFATTAVCGIATAPPGVVFSAVYDFTAPSEGVIAALAKGVLAEISRIGLAAPLLAACGVGVVGENVAAGATGPVSSQLAGDLLVDWAVRATGAPPIAEGVQRQFGRSLGEMHVIDSGPDGTTFYTGEEGSSMIRVPTAPFERWLLALAAGATAAAGDAVAAPDLSSWTAEAPYVPPIPGRRRSRYSHRSTGAGRRRPPTHPRCPLRRAAQCRSAPHPPGRQSRCARGSSRCAR